MPSQRPIRDQTTALPRRRCLSELYYILTKYLAKLPLRYMHFDIMKGGTQGFSRHEVSDKQEVLFEDVSPSTAFSIRQHLHALLNRQRWFPSHEHWLDLE